MRIVSLYAALLAILFIILSIRTIRMRRSLKIAIGDSGSPAMLRAMRVHSNFAEYVPLTLFLVALVEVGSASSWVVHALGSLLLVGRLSHAYGVSQTTEVFAFRVSGMAMTFTTILFASLILLYEFLWPRVA
jgi:uncharacterized membrane protein YecN with MAPEG domain